MGSPDVGRGGDNTIGGGLTVGQAVVTKGRCLIVLSDPNWLQTEEYLCFVSIPSGDSFGRRISFLSMGRMWCSYFPRE